MELPTIDFSAAESSPEKKGRELLDACIRLGCFRVSGGDVPPAALLQAMKSAARRLLDLPEDVKRRNVNVIPGSGYVGPAAGNPLYEALGVYVAASPASVDVRDFCDRLAAPCEDRETIEAYTSKIHDLVVGIAVPIAETLGVAGVEFKQWPCQLWLNKYSFTEETIGSIGVRVHTDRSFLTVLQEDDAVRGLEIYVDDDSGDGGGVFVPVNPVPDTLLVILGDIAKVWSNGRLRNLKHRVRCMEAATRVSVAMFLLGPAEGAVEPPPEMVDEENPLLYQPFTYEYYRRLRLSSESRAGEVLSLLLAGNPPPALP